MAKETEKAFIRKFIAGNCGPLERERMSVFLEQPGSAELFHEVLNEEWQGFKKGKQTSNAYIQSFQQRLQERLDSAARRPLRRRLNFYRYAAVWAFLVLGAASYSIWQFNKNAVQPVAMLFSHNPNGQRSRVMLADSSIVTLGAGSTLSYPERFAGNTREISLEGEAFFEVTKNPDKPFIVHTGAVQTRVLGTSFKINAFKGQPVLVAVATGKVRVGRKLAGKTGLEQLAVLLPGDEVEWNPGSGKAAISHVQTEDVAAWEKGRLSFVGVPLSEMVTSLERWYNVKILIRNKKIMGYRMSVILDGTQPLNRSLEILKATLKADYQTKGNTVIIH
jgi:transmembrane sensor